MAIRFSRPQPGRFGCLLGLACLLSIAVAQPVAAEGEQLLVRPASQTIAVGATATVSIEISGPEPVYGVELHLRFDPQRLQVIDADGARSGIQGLPGSLFAGKQVFTARNLADNGQGRLDYAATLVGEAAGVTRGGQVLVISFEGREAGDSEIEISQATVANPEGLQVPVTLQGGHVTVTEGTSSEPTAQPVATVTAATRLPPTATATQVQATAQPEEATPEAAEATVEPAEPPASAAPGTPGKAAPAAATAYPVYAATELPPESETLPAAEGPTAAPAVSPGWEAGAPSRATFAFEVIAMLAGLAIAIGALVGLYAWWRGRR